jgi:glycosyltransferase involved in cell wall biosynthesis
MYSDRPYYTIITINRNHREGLQATLATISAQTFQDFELIIIDGHSTDGSDEVIEQYKHIVTYAEKDKGKGIYAAMNQGVALARGEWTIFMNAGDRFFDSHVLDSVKETLQGDLAYGRVWRDGQDSPVKHQALDDIWKGNAFCHQALFTRTAWVKRFPFKTRYKIVADYDFYVTAMQHGAQFYNLDMEIAKIEATGLGTDYTLRRTWERYLVVLNKFPEKPIHRYYLPRIVKLLLNNL